MLSHIIHLFPILPSHFILFFSLLISHFTIIFPPIFPPLLLPFYFPTTLYLNVTILPSLHFSFILNLFLPILFIIKICYFLFYSIYIFPTQKRWILSLSLSLSLSFPFILWIFNSLLHLYFRLMNFLCWTLFWDDVIWLCFNSLSFFFYFLWFYILSYDIIVYICNDMMLFYFVKWLG